MGILQDHILSLLFAHKYHHKKMLFVASLMRITKDFTQQVRDSVERVTQTDCAITPALIAEAVHAVKGKSAEDDWKWVTASDDDSDDTDHSEMTKCWVTASDDTDHSEKTVDFDLDRIEHIVTQLQYYRHEKNVMACSRVAGWELFVLEKESSENVERLTENIERATEYIGRLSYEHN